MKILSIVADVNPGRLGGAEGHFVEVAKRLAPKLKKLTVLVGDDDNLKKLLPKAEIVIVSYPHIPNLYGLFYILFAAVKGFALMRQEKYDLIWAKQEYPQAQVGAILKLVFKVPLYITSQNPRLNQEEFVGLNVFSELLTPLISWSFQQADVVAAVSTYSADLAKKMGAKRVEIVPNGVDLSKFR